MPDSEIRKVVIDRRERGLITPLDADILLNSINTQNFRQLATKGIKYYVFGIDVVNGRLIYPEDEKNRDFEDEMMNMVRLILFTELSDIETVVIAPGQSSGTKREGKHLNESQVPVTIVDSSWNKKIVRENGFTVRGHLRLQPYGPGMQYRKYIYIDEFEKKGYTRIVNERIC